MLSSKSTFCLCSCLPEQVTLINRHTFNDQDNTVHSDLTQRSRINRQSQQNSCPQSWEGDIRESLYIRSDQCSRYDAQFMKNIESGIKSDKKNIRGRESQDAQFSSSKLKTQTIQSTIVSYPKQPKLFLNKQISFGLPEENQETTLAHSRFSIPQTQINQQIQQIVSANKNSFKKSEESKVRNESCQLIQCQIHDENISYFCFDCRCKCICPECAIHGKHNGHDVKTIMKARQVLEIEVQNLSEIIENKILEENWRKEWIERGRQELIHKNESYKKQIMQGFADLRQRLAYEENKIKQNYDKALEQSLVRLEDSMTSIDLKIESIQNYRKQLNQIKLELDEMEVILHAEKVPGNQIILQAILDIYQQVSNLSAKENFVMK